jgi:hypothetical protein
MCQIRWPLIFILALIQPCGAPIDLHNASYSWPSNGDYVRASRFCTEPWITSLCLRRSRWISSLEFAVRLSWNLFVETYSSLLQISFRWESFFTLCPEIHRRFKSFEMVSLFVTKLKRQHTFVPFRWCLEFLNVSLDSRSMFDVQLYVTIVSGFRNWLYLQ